MACPPDNSDSCGCLYPSNSGCITLRNIERDCIDDYVFNGKTLTQGLNKIIEYVCDNVSPSGYTFITESCNSSITVSQSIVGDQVIYTVCLNPQITTNISNAQSDIAAINACLTDTVKDITSDSLDVTVSSTSDCGRTLRIEYSPSGDAEYDGIVWNDFTKNGTNAAGGVQVLKSYTRNYAVDSRIGDGDEIRWRISGQVASDGGITDTIRLEIMDVNSAIVLYSVDGTGNPTSPFTSYNIEGTITVDYTNSQAYLTFLDDHLHVANGTANSTALSGGVINSLLTGVDYSSLGIRVSYVNNTNLGATDNFVRQLMVEVRKKI